jgi:hypothetical protein
MKKMKKVITMLLSMLMLVTAFAGCGTSFDASAYLKAILDNSYKHDSTDFVKQKIGTKDEAEQLFQDGIDSNMSAMTSSLELSDELKPEFESLFEQIYGVAKYTVGKAEKQDDNSYVVTVTYQPMNLFADANTAFQDKVTALTEKYTEQATNGGEVPDQAALQEEVLVLYKDCLLDSLDSVSYGDETSMEIKIELADKVYSPNSSDLATLENALLSTDSAQ